MDETQQNQNVPQAPEQPPVESQPKEAGSKGALFGAIIVVLLLIALGVYVFMTRDTAPTDISDEEAAQIEEGILNLPDTQRASLESQDASDALSSIEEDVDTTDLDGLDAELGAIEQELGEALE